jgi:ubiquinone/menaquinone biosynthesis C-methylase UbiE
VTVSDQRDYVLRGGDLGAERLKLLASVKWPTTKPLLERAGLRPGLNCLDVGCGAGAVTFEMVKAVKPTGRVTGIDFDERCVRLARAEAQKFGLDVEFRTGSANELEDCATYDLVFARFLLTHLLEPEAALERMVQATIPGGVVVVEDIQFTGHFSYPACPAFDRYVSLYQNVVRPAQRWRSKHWSSLACSVSRCRLNRRQVGSDSAIVSRGAGKADPFGDHGTYSGSSRRSWSGIR